MTNILLIIILIGIFFILLFPLFLKLKRNKRLTKKTIITTSYKPFLEEQKSNPDISTENWELHKIRLEKFRRSQYKGLTFFLNSENRIYYISEEGDKVYC